MDYVITGRVIKGDGYGRKLGFPTANLNLDKDQIIPLEGVYAGVAVLDSVEYRAGIVVGLMNKVEAHLIGYSGDAYGKQIILKINKFLRKYKNFNTEQELIIQIKKDIDKC